MTKWNDLMHRQGLDRIAGAVQRLCLLVVIAVELLFFLPGEAVDGLVYLFLEWKLVDISILFLAASCCCGRLRESKWYFLFALVSVLWFYVLRGVHLELEQTSQDPGTFVCAYALCFPFAAATGDREKKWGLKWFCGVFILVGAVFGIYAVLLVTRHLPACLEGYVFWDGARFGTMGHPNICATVLMISIGLTAGLALTRKKLKYPLLLLTALEFWALCLTNSRAAIIMTCALLGGTAFCYLRRPNWKRTALALLAAVVVMGGLFSLSREIFSWNSNRLTQMAQQAQLTGEETGLSLDENGELKTENGQDSSMAASMKTLNGRTEIWSAAAQALKDHPWILLRGTENAGQIISPYWTRMDTLHAHNAWIQTLFQLGIPGLLMALALSVLAVWDGVVILWRGDDLLACTVAMVVLCLMGCAVMEPYLFTVTAQFHYFDFLFFLCLGYMNQWRGKKLCVEGERENV